MMIALKAEGCKVFSGLIEYHFQITQRLDFCLDAPIAPQYDEFELELT